MLQCSFCHKRGASVGCCHNNCSNNYHFMCASKAKVGFVELIFICYFGSSKNLYGAAMITALTTFISRGPAKQRLDLLNWFLCWLPFWQGILFFPCIVCMLFYRFFLSIFQRRNIVALHKKMFSSVFH